MRPALSPIPKSRLRTPLWHWLTGPAIIWRSSFAQGVSDMPEHVIARRKALKYFGMLASTAAGREFLAAWLPSAMESTREAGRSEPVTMPGMHHGPPQDQHPPYVPLFFKPPEFQTVQILTEMIIPTDD